jgi:hypothetical protein
MHNERPDPIFLLTPYFFMGSGNLNRASVGIRHSQVPRQFVATWSANRHRKAKAIAKDCRGITICVFI